MKHLYFVVVSTFITFSMQARAEWYHCYYNGVCLAKPDHHSDQFSCDNCEEEQGQARAKLAGNPRNTFRIEIIRTVIQPSRYNDIKVPTEGFLVSDYLFHVNQKKVVAAGNAPILSSEWREKKPFEMSSMCRDIAAGFSFYVKPNGVICFTKVDPAAYDKRIRGQFGEDFGPRDLTGLPDNMDIEIVAPDIDIEIEEVKALNLRVSAKSIICSKPNFDIHENATFKTNGGDCLITAVKEYGTCFSAKGNVTLIKGLNQGALQGNNVSHRSINFE